MRMNFTKKIFVFTAVIMLFLIVVPSAHALTQSDLWGGNGLQNQFQNSVGLNDTDPREIVGKVIRVLLGFLGIIAVVIILWSGFQWMTAGGNEDKIDGAKKMLAAGVIGLIIIMASYGLAAFMMNAIVNATA